MSVAGVTRLILPIAAKQNPTNTTEERSGTKQSGNTVTSNRSQISTIARSIAHTHSKGTEKRCFVKHTMGGCSISAVAKGGCLKEGAIRKDR